MQILICPNKFKAIEGLMTDLKNQLSIVYPRIIYVKHAIYIKPDIEILFIPAWADDHITGMHPDYYWTESNDVDTYFKDRRIKELKSFPEIVHVVLEECMSKIKEG